MGDPQLRIHGCVTVCSHYNMSPHDQQVAVFRKQCAMAVELKLPLIVHSREAEQETIA